MILQIPFRELETYIQQKYKQQIELAYVNGNTITVSKMVWIKKVSVNISVTQLVGSDVTLSYETGIGIDLIIKGALKWFKENIDNIVEEQDNSNTILVHLNEIDPLKKPLERINIRQIEFDTNNINLAFMLK